MIESNSLVAVPSDLEAEPSDIIRARRRLNLPILIGSLLVVALLVGAAYKVVAADFIDFGVVRDFLFSTTILEGAKNTIVLALLAQLGGMCIGILLAVLRRSENLILSGLAGVYVWIFRGTPLLIQLLFWFNAVPMAFPDFHLSIPVIGVELFNMPTTDLMTAFTAALIGLALNEGAYYSEIVRSGINGVGSGQIKAARALGLTSGQTFSRVVLPQALRIVIPATGNQFILVLKNTSLAFVVTYAELLGSASKVYSVNYKIMELLIVASLWYLLFTSLANVGQHYIEKKVKRG